MNLSKTCLNCKQRYSYKKEEEMATHMKEYCHHLGCCTEECYSKLPVEHRNYLVIEAICQHDDEKMAKVRSLN